MAEEQPVVEWKYKEPIWSSEPPETQRIQLEVLKDGNIAEDLDLHELLQRRKSKYESQGEKGGVLYIGRLPVCDISLENPSISRYNKHRFRIIYCDEALTTDRCAIFYFIFSQHAVLQFRNTGECYIYDLCSVHGTFHNKSRIPPKKYIKLNPGDFLKFGESTRKYVFGPIVPQEQNESEETAAEEVIKNKLVEEGAIERTEEEKKKIITDINGDQESIFQGSFGDARQFIKDERKKELEKMRKKGKKGKLKGKILKLDESEGKGGRDRADIDLAYFDKNVFGKGAPRGKEKKEEKEDSDDEEDGEGGEDEGRRVQGYDAYLGRDDFGDENDDQFYDRTKEAAKKFVRPVVQARKALTSTELRANILKLFEEELEWQEKFNELEKDKKEDVSDGKDELEAFMQGVQDSLQDEKRKNIARKLQEISKNKEAEEKLWKASLSHLTRTREENTLNEAKEKILQKRKGLIKRSHIVGPSTADITTAEQSHSAESFAENQSSDTKLEGFSEKKESKTPILPPPSIGAIKRARIEPAATTTLQNKEDTVEKESKTAKKKRKKVEKERKIELEKFSDSSLYEEWVAPVGQTGDGRTALNEKLGY